MKNENSQVKLGAVLSYILVALNAVYGLFLTPFILRQIGEASYGVYKTVAAFTSSLMVLDLGLGGTMMRYIAKYRADKEEHKIPNFAAMSFVQTTAICAVLALVSGVLYFFLDTIYETGLTVAELGKAKQLYIFLALGLLAHLYQNVLNGIIAGYNRFAFANGIKVVRLVARIALVFLLLGVFKDPLTLVLIDLFSTIFFALLELWYLFVRLKVKVKLVRWEQNVFIESFGYTILMFLTSLVAQANTNLSNVIIGASISSTAVTVYSLAILIYGIYQQLSTSISGVMLPTVTSSLKDDDKQYSRTIALIAKVGRIQFLLLGAAGAGFLVLGRQFIEIWLGAGYEDVYWLTLILMGPALLELCVNVCLSILRAQNLLGFRTIVITITAAVNLLIMLIGAKHLGYYICAISTAGTYFLGSVVVMGIYYYKKMRINLLKLYRDIFKGIWISVAISALAAFGAAFAVRGISLGNISNAMVQFVVGFVAFMVVYVATLLVFGLNKNEKNTLFSKVRRIKK